MRNEDHGGATAKNLVHFLEASILKHDIADAQHFVHDQDVGIDVRRHGEPQPGVHAGRVSFYRSIDEVGETRELHDGVEFSIDLLPIHAQDGAVQVDIFSSGEVGMKSGPHFDEGGEPAMHINRPPGRFHNAGNELQNGAFACSISADNSERFSTIKSKTDLTE